MFDFSIEQNQKQRPTKRLFASAAASCLVHLLILIVLIENPWLLHGGMYHRFRGLIVAPDASEFTFDDEEGNFRTVAVLRPMVAPSAETLKKNTYDWNKRDNPDSKPPVRVRWGEEQQDAPDEDSRQYSLVGPELENPLGGNEDATDLAGIQDDIIPEPEGGPDATPPETVGVLEEPAAKEDTPGQQPEPATEEKLAANTAPSRIPDSIARSENQTAGNDITIFEDAQQAIKSPGGGLFDTQDFPLEEYASTIKKRVTNNWYIPSNLRRSDQFTTIVFFIDRDGQNFGTQIVESSGNNSLDITALNAIINSNPFPPLPPGFPGDHIGVKYIFIPEPQ
ncbi:MAG: TonB C-terminal domain-containing protein [Acidobacteria bacterium]|nr:TonB C-terminal domain-containing protein [Acidobacteriota bacterium]